MQDAKISYLLPDVFKLFYTLSYFFQTSIDLTCRNKRCGTTLLYVYPCNTKSSSQLTEEENIARWNQSLYKIPCLTAWWILCNISFTSSLSYLVVFSCQPWLWLRQCPHSVCHKVSYAQKTKRGSTHRSNKTQSPQQSNQNILSGTDVTFS